MKILLTAINAKYIHSNPAVYSLKAYAEAHMSLEGAECRIELAEFTINHRADEILQQIFLRQPQVLGISCYIWNLEMVEKLLADLPQILPDTDIWLGGPEVSYDAPQYLQGHPQVKGILAGEGEASFAKLAEAYAKGEADADGLARIGGLIWKERGRIRVNPALPLLNMDEIPFLYSDPDVFHHRMIYYESSRGCPFSCSYCLSSIDRRVRFRSPEKVKRELQIFLDQRVPQVKFVDRTFNCRHSHAMEIWRYLRGHDNGVTNFHFEIAAELLNEEELELLGSLRPGLVQLEIGVQSTNARTLAEIDRVSDFKRLSEIVRRLQGGRNIHLHLDLIAGLPWEDYESFGRSFDDVYRLHPQQLQLGFLKVLKGSKMREKAKEYGLCCHAGPVYEVLYTRWLSYGDVLRLKAVEEMVEVYYNSGQFARTMAALEAEFSGPFAMYEALADHYEKHDLRNVQHSRAARFEILHDFIQTRSGAPLYEETLLLDMCLRENCRSRPEWARDPAPERERILAFYQREAEQPLYLSGYEGRSARQLMNMTHLEHFSYQVCGDGQKKDCWLLFDYRSRDPLSYDARVCDVSAEFIENNT